MGALIVKYNSNGRQSPSSWDLNRKTPYRFNEQELGIPRPGVAYHRMG
jgi:hypothetical protein